MSIDPREIIAPDVLDLLDESVFLRDMDGRILYWNRAAADLYGWTAQQALGKNAHRLLNTRIDGLATDPEPGLHDEGPWHGRLTRMTASGAAVTVEACWSLRRDANGNPAAILEVNRDASTASADREHAAREHAEFMYRNLFYGTALPFLRLDSSRLQAMFAGLRKAGVVDLADYLKAHPGFVRAAMDASIVVEANEPAARMHRVEDPCALLGPLSRFWVPGKEEAFRNSLAAGFAGAPGFQGETKILTLDGREIDVMLFVIATPQMRERGIVLVGHVDIAEQVAARAALERLRADLAHAARVSMLGELTASIAHEVNQPLTAITINAEAGLRWLARLDPDIAETRTLMRRVVDDARRAADIIQRIRRMAMRRSAETAPTTINAVVEETALFLGHELEAQQVALALELADGLPAVRADRVQLQQVIVNLAMNAIQAMSDVAADRRRLRIVTGATDSKAVFVRIEDSGSGIPPDQVPRLFEHFHSTKPDGLGLGLPISQSIVEAHGGRIEGDNNADIGARFTFTLPACGDAA